MSGIIWTVLIVLAIAIGGLLMIAAGKPDTFTVRRSIHIKAPQEKVFGMINDLIAWKSWSPWQNKDPGMRQTISPNSAGIDASQEWEGNSKVGTGRMTITDSVPHDRVTFRLDFLKPFKATNMAGFVLREEAEGTEVIWTMNGPAPLISKIMDTLMNMDKMIGRDFEQGLANLKALSERPVGV
jgi:uncharacterized protein YndB with AHSA1/START domain